jgi:tetraacyldisaccharide 4'-kinase
LLKKFKYLLLPVSIIYGAVVWLRNFLFDKKIFRSSSFNFPLICIGNLATGGTGKTPMTEYLVTFLKDNFKTATLSRGYKRKTKGFAIAGENTTALEIGDEPMQFHQKFKDVTVAVGEERLVAIPQLLHDRPETEVIILDDAFQHRSVAAGLNILLTDYSNLYTRDSLLPVGDLRDIISSAKRANIIIVTKCKAGINIDEKKSIEKELNILPQQKVFFTEILYAQPYHLFNFEMTDMSKKTNALVITGIANPLPLKDFMSKQVNSFEMMGYPDHHIFTSTDLTNIRKKFSALPENDRIIITTEKDAVRLQKFEKELSDYPIYAIPVQHHFLFNEGNDFENSVSAFVRSFSSEIL